MKRALGILVPLAIAACDSSPPVKTAAGVRLDYVRVEERFQLNPEGKSKEWTGDDLRKAVPLLDKNGIFDLLGHTYEAKDVVESATLILTVKPLDQTERTITVKNCAQEKICAFFTEAHAQGLVPRKPVVCGASSAPCGK